MEAGKLRETHDKNKGANIDMQDTQETMKYHCTATIAEDNPLRLDTLILSAESRARRGKRAHEPIPPSSEGTPNATSSLDLANLASGWLKEKGRKKPRRNNIAVAVAPIHRTLPHRPRKASSRRIHKRRGPHGGTIGMNK